MAVIDYLGNRWQGAMRRFGMSKTMAEDYADTWFRSMRQPAGDCALPRAYFHPNCEMPCYDNIDLVGSDRWFTCRHPHMHRNGRKCQCNTGFAANAVTGNCEECNMISLAS